MPDNKNIHVIALLSDVFFEQKDVKNETIKDDPADIIKSVKYN